MVTTTNKIFEKYKNKKFVLLVLHDYSPISKKLVSEMEKIKDITIYYEYYDKEEPQIIFLIKGKPIKIIKGLIPKEVIEIELEKMKKLFFSLYG